MIQLNNEERNKKANNAYNKVGFLAQTLIPLIDDFMDTDKPKRLFKKACNDLLSEAVKMNNEHYADFSQFGKIANPEGLEHESLDIYNITAKAYDEAYEFFTTRKPNHVVSIMELIKRLEADGIDLNEIAVNYEPLLK